MKESWGKIEPVRKRPAKKGPTCTKWQCKSAALVKLTSGRELSTRSGGFALNLTGQPQLVCPNCCKFYTLPA